MHRNKAANLIVRLKYPGMFFLSSGLIAWDQIRRVRRKIQKCMSPKVWNRQPKPPEYIYIHDHKMEDTFLKYEIAGISNELYKVAQLYLWLSGKLRASQFYEDIFSFHQNVAWRFFRLAQDDNFFHRQRAVQALAHMSSLSDATCREIAQACDKRTAAGLARTSNVDFRLLLDPPEWNQSVDYNALIIRLHNFMAELDAESRHPCLQKVIADTFLESDPRSFDDDVGFNNTIKHDVVEKCTQAILHHSWIAANARSIIQHGGIPILIDIYKFLEHKPEKLDLLIALSRILSNLSMQFDYHQQLFSYGCFKILARLLRHYDVRVSVPAGRALLNFDSDATNSQPEHFLRNVYNLYPLYRSFPIHASNVDVVFVHGLLGGVFVTWRQRDLEVILTKGEQSLNDLPIDNSLEKHQWFPRFRKVFRKDWEKIRSQCWPRDWLARDCPNIRILGVNYDTNISMWAPRCPISSQRPSLTDRSTHLIQVLKEAGVGKRPIIWVAHSMGGLIVKDLIVKCSESENDTEKSLFEKTKGVVFFSTPHRGSRLAKMSSASQMIVWPTIEVQELRQGSSALLKLHEKFIKLTKLNLIKVLSFAEREPTYVNALKMDLRFVEDESSFIEVGELYGVPLDHLCVCKPAVRDSFLYQKVMEFIEDIISDVNIK